MTIEKIIKEKKNVIIREVNKEDLPSIIDVYQKAFAGEPWNEYRLCSKCGEEYSINDFLKSVEYNKCKVKECNGNFKSEEYWKPEDIIRNINETISKKGLAYVAENGQGIVGFVWGNPGYPEAREELSDIIKSDSFYMKEIAVDLNCQDKGVGSKLAEAFVDKVKEKGYSGTYLRTNLKNSRAIRVFEKAGYERTEILDQGKKDCFYMVQGDCYVK
jgi:GNAT superfamily N-acetyltransferase